MVSIYDESEKKGIHTLGTGYAGGKMQFLQFQMSVLVFEKEIFIIST